jgi:16S rRNA (uracil1498-N3)-methyltransferase
MPATPAWPPESAPRLFVSDTLSEVESVTIAGPQAHYLLNVMRLREGGCLKLCDNQTGEWLGRIESAGKRDCVVSIEAKLRERENVPDLWLLAAPIKKARIDWLVEKATELGLARYQPVITQRTIVERMNLGRLRTHMVEAAEQCGRTALPELAEAEKLATSIKKWPQDRTLYFADEHGGEPLPKALSHNEGPTALLIGPEGGFTADERDMIRGMAKAKPVSLGPRILRAETAAIAAITIFMATIGDWR